ncbi:MAG: flagellar basal body rod protein FlgB [Candidatus Schekmanbacteria bacterium]|nr:MAG: flagellar basal body rod protein FlgB [Candidatus Schekmanbacteria bacterium]
MPDNGIFGVTINLLKEVLDARASRQLIINSNIANAETPGYKAKDLKFRSLLNDNLNSHKAISLKATNKKHITDGNNKSLIETKIETSNKKPLIEGSSNNVNIDREMTKLAENGIMYNALAQITAKKFSFLKEVIRESGVR